MRQVQWNLEERVVTLRVVSGPLCGVMLVLRRGSNLVGRGVECTHRLLHPTISRYHCEVFVSETVVHLSDQNSLHGVMVNGRLVLQSELAPSDVVQLGEVPLVVETRCAKSGGLMRQLGSPELGTTKVFPTAPLADSPAPVDAPPPLPKGPTQSALASRRVRFPVSSAPMHVARPVLPHLIPREQGKESGKGTEPIEPPV